MEDGVVLVLSPGLKIFALIGLRSSQGEDGFVLSGPAKQSQFYKSCRGLPYL